MAVRKISGLEELRSCVGQRLGTSDWLEITQDRVQRFAEVTGDVQWIHCDADRARSESPFGTTVAHGFLTLSLCSMFTSQIYTIEGVKLVVNYGLNRVRFPAPVPTGVFLRMSTDLLELKSVGAAEQAICKLTFEVQGSDKPVCVAETVTRLFF